MCSQRLVTDDVYRHLLKRVVLSARASGQRANPGAPRVLDRLDLDLLAA